MSQVGWSQAPVASPPASAPVADPAPSPSPPATTSPGSAPPPPGGDSLAVAPFSPPVAPPLSAANARIQQAEQAPVNAVADAMAGFAYDHHTSSIADDTAAGSDGLTAEQKAERSKTGNCVELALAAKDRFEHPDRYGLPGPPVPARVVEGTITGPDGVARNHEWVEYQDPSSDQWRSFDPTAAATSHDPKAAFQGFRDTKYDRKGLAEAGYRAADAEAAPPGDGTGSTPLPPDPGPATTTPDQAAAFQTSLADKTSAVDSAQRAVDAKNNQLNQYLASAPLTQDEKKAFADQWRKDNSEYDNLQTAKDGLAKFLTDNRQTAIDMISNPLKSSNLGNDRSDAGFYALKALEKLGQDPATNALASGILTDVNDRMANHPENWNEWGPDQTQAFQEALAPTATEAATLAVASGKDPTTTDLGKSLGAVRDGLGAPNDVRAGIGKLGDGINELQKLVANPSAEGFENLLQKFGAGGSLGHHLAVAAGVLAPFLIGNNADEGAIADALKNADITANDLLDIGTASLKNAEVLGKGVTDFLEGSSKVLGAVGSLLAEVSDYGKYAATKDSRYAAAAFLDAVSAGFGAASLLVPGFALIAGAAAVGSAVLGFLGDGDAKKRSDAQAATILQEATSGESFPGGPENLSGATALKLISVSPDSAKSLQALGLTPEQSNQLLKDGLLPNDLTGNNYDLQIVAGGLSKLFAKPDGSPDGAQVEALLRAADAGVSDANRSYEISTLAAALRQVEASNTEFTKQDVIDALASFINQPGLNTTPDVVDPTIIANLTNALSR